MSSSAKFKSFTFLPLKYILEFVFGYYISKYDSKEGNISTNICRVYIVVWWRKIIKVDSKELLVRIFFRLWPVWSSVCAWDFFFFSKTAIMDFQFLETIYLRDLKDFYKHERTNCLQNQVVLVALLLCSEEQNRCFDNFAFFMYSSIRTKINMTLNSSSLNIFYYPICMTRLLCFSKHPPQKFIVMWL